MSLVATNVVVSVMAVMAVMLGIFWSGHTRHNLRLKRGLEADAERLEDEDPGTEQPQDGEEELSKCVSPLLVLFCVLFMCTEMALLYFFYDQLGGF